MNRLSSHRLFHILLFAAALALCALVVVFAKPLPEVRGFAGDALVVVLIYALAQAIRPFPPLPLALSVLGLAFAVEFAQFAKAGETFGWNQNPLARFVFGSVFDPLDLLAYTLGAGISVLTGLWKPSAKPGK